MNIRLLIGVCPASIVKQSNDPIPEGSVLRLILSKVGVGRRRGGDGRLVIFGVGRLAVGGVDRLGDANREFRSGLILMNSSLRVGV